MNSPAKIAASRANGRRSRGPRTAAGKAKASRNALRHGLAAISRQKPEFFAEIEAVAKAICDGSTNPLLFDQALIIAENDLVLGCVQAERIAAIERHRDSTATALATGDLGFARARATFARAKLMYETRVKWAAQSGVSEQAAPTATQTGSRQERQSSVADHAGISHTTVERDEFDAMCSALPDLHRLERYRRRAWSRQRRAMRRFMEIHSACVVAGPHTEPAQVDLVAQRSVSDAT